MLCLRVLVRVRQEWNSLECPLQSIWRQYFNIFIQPTLLFLLLFSACLCYCIAYMLRCVELTHTSTVFYDIYAAQYNCHFAVGFSRCCFFFLLLLVIFVLYLKRVYYVGQKFRNTQKYTSEII